MNASSVEAASVQAVRKDGFYLRRLLEVMPIAGGIRATVSLIAFRDAGDERRSIIVSDEPLARQMINTHVPNRPAEMSGGESTATVQQLTLEIQALSSRILRVRLGMQDDLLRSRDMGMLVPGILDALSALPVLSTAHIMEAEEAITVTVAGFRIRLGRDPFALQIVCTDVPAARIETALEDRNVHGLLSTPPPGMRLTAKEAGAMWSWALTPDEHLYGLGERFTRLDQRGEHITLWNTDAWGTTGEASYKYVPFVQSSRGYGLFFHTSTATTMGLGTPSQRSATVSVAEPSLDLFMVFGAQPKEILGEYTRLTGRATMPPRWAFGVWLSRCRYNTRAEVEGVAERARAEAIPCDVLHIDPAWLELPNLSCDFAVNETAFPDLAGMIRKLGERGFKISLWELPYVASNARHYREALEAGYFLRDEQGEAISADFGAAPADGRTHAVLDFTNPAARAWWQNRHRPLLQAGVAVFKTDFGEGVPVDAQAYNGMTGRELHNLFPLLYNAAVHEVITEEMGRPGMVWGRSGWAGTQRYPAQWGGDPKTDVWSMASSLRGGLNLALSAPGVWAHDIGGFYGSPPSPELYIRWAQFGLLSPLARAHGTTPREPWEFGEEALAIFRRYAMLRMRLNPYLYNVAWEAHEQGLPMLRPLLLEFPDDPMTAHIDDSYMLGSSILVAPIFSEAREPVARQLYLPAGEWVDYWTDERITGGRYITRLATLDTIPVYVRVGTLLPLGPECSFISEESPDMITLEVYPGVESESRIVWDATGTATQFHLQRAGGDRWRLDIMGERVVSWHVRSHTNRGITEVDGGHGASANVVL